MTKKINLFALGLCLVAIPFSKSLAQEQTQEKQNLVKLNLLPLAGGTVALEYERPISNKFTLGGMVSLRPANSTLPYFSSWKSSLDDEDLEATLKNTKQGAFSLAAEARYYTSNRGTFRGFYLAPYLKYATYSLKAPIEVDLEGDAGAGIEAINEVNTKGSINTYSAGLALGFQFKLGKSMFLDWRLVGASYGFSNGNLNGKADRLLTSIEQDEVRDQLNDIKEDIPVMKIEPSVNAEGVDIKVKGPWANLRTGLSIGYRF